eukprot:m.1347026 g.1347026  ORF g.1347026 m.1347026 type:complete len:158 (+) comp24908_c2_seq16:171-644(+)
MGGLFQSSEPYIVFIIQVRERQQTTISIARVYLLPCVLLNVQTTGTTCCKRYVCVVNAGEEVCRDGAALYGPRDFHRCGTLTADGVTLSRSKCMVQCWIDIIFSDNLYPHTCQICMWRDWALHVKLFSSALCVVDTKLIYQRRVNACNIRRFACDEG